MLFDGDPARHILVVDGAAAEPEAQDTLSSVRALGKCCIVRAYTELEQAEQAVAQGMYPAVLDGFFPWAADLWQQYQILRCLQIGLHPLPRDLKASAPHHAWANESPDSSAGTLLTPREREVFSHMTAGTMTASIAVQLGISEDAVKLHVDQIVGKLGFENALPASPIEARFRG